MIELFRSFSQSWLARGFFLLMALIFLVMWGGGDWSRQFSSHQQSIATVGGEKISAWDFFTELHRMMRQVQLSTGRTLDEQQAKEMGLYGYVREKLIAQKLIDLEAVRLGLYVDDDEVKAFIKNDKLFHDDKGVFQKARFEAIMKNIGYTEASYVEALRHDLLKDRLIKALGSATKAPYSITSPLYAWQNEIRSVSAIVLSTDDLRLNLKITDEELKKFYEERKEKLTAPEYRDVTLLCIDQKKLMDAVMISQSELKVSYDQRSDKTKSFVEVKDQLAEELKRQRTLESFDKLINQVEDQLGQGKSLEEIAKDLNLVLTTYKRVDQKGQGDSFLKQPTAVDDKDLKAIEEAFTLDLEGHSSPFESASGYYRVVRVDGITPSSMRSFEEVKGKLTELWVMSKKLEIIKNKAESLAQEVSKGSPLPVVASRENLKIVQGKLSRKGPLGPSVLALSNPMVEYIYSLNLEQAIALPYALNDQKGDYIVIQVVKQEKPDMKENPQGIKDFQANLNKMFVEDIMILYIHSLRKRFPVDINQSFFAKLPRQAKRNP